MLSSRSLVRIEGINDVITLSDFHLHSPFGRDYGVLMTDGPLSGLFARAIIVISPEGTVIHTQLLPEVTQEPDYKAALESRREE